MNDGRVLFDEDGLELLGGEVETEEEGASCGLGRHGREEARASLAATCSGI